MKCANARKLDRKSGVRFGERGAPVRFPSTAIELLRRGSREEVEELTAKAIDAGGKRAIDPVEIHVWSELLRPRRTPLGDGLAGQSTAASVGSERAPDGIAVGYDEQEKNCSA
jgi:hypothetical protein